MTENINKKSIEDINVTNKKVLVRCDFNVPLDMDNRNKITNFNRILESMKTIEYLIKNNAKIILCSHIGKTGQNISLAPVAKKLSGLLGKEVPLIKEIIGESVRNITDNMHPKDVVLLENLRMFEQEEANDANFAKELASLADIYVNDAFGSVHRAHASTVGVTKYLPSVYGFLIKKELEALGNAINNPQRPLVAIIGGSKVSSKIDVIKNLLKKVDTLLIGGGMAYTFAKALGGNIGNSIVEEEKREVAIEILNIARLKNVEIILPVDTIAADKFANDANTIISDIMNIPDGYEGLDIGPKTIDIFNSKIEKAGTVVWNGPVGVFEFDLFDKGTREIAEKLANSNCISIIGGGDSVAAVYKYGLENKMKHVSTGGGASLEFMEGKVLPGIASLNDK